MVIKVETVYRISGYIIGSTELTTLSKKVMFIGKTFHSVSTVVEIMLV